MSSVSPGGWDKRGEAENAAAKSFPAHVQQNHTLSVLEMRYLEAVIGKFSTVKKYLGTISIDKS